MSLRTNLLPIVDAARSIASDVKLSGNPGIDIRTVCVIVRTRTWSSGHPQTGTPVVVDLEIIPRPHVQGMVGDPVLTVGPITPAYGAGGYTPAQLNPADSPGMEWVYIAIAPDGVQRPYKLMQMTTPRPFRYMLQLQSLDIKVPF